VSGVVDARTRLLGRDLAVEISGHSLEIGDHRFDLGDLTPLLIDMEALQSDQGFTRLHTGNTPRHRLGFS
jgi:hypothetical protein